MTLTDVPQRVVAYARSRVLSQLAAARAALAIISVRRSSQPPQQMWVDAQVLHSAHRTGAASRFSQQRHV